MAQLLQVFPACSLGTGYLCLLSCLEQSFHSPFNVREFRTIVSRIRLRKVRSTHGGLDFVEQ